MRWRRRRRRRARRRRAPPGAWARLRSDGARRGRERACSARWRGGPRPARLAPEQRPRGLARRRQRASDRTQPWVRAPTALAAAVHAPPAAAAAATTTILVVAAESSERSVGGGVTGQAVRGPPPPRGRRLPPGLMISLMIAPALPCSVGVADRGGGLDGLVGTRLHGSNSAGFALAFGV